MNRFIVLVNVLHWTQWSLIHNPLVRAYQLNWIASERLQQAQRSQNHCARRCQSRNIILYTSTPGYISIQEDKMVWNGIEEVGGENLSKSICMYVLEYV